MTDQPTLVPVIRFFQETRGGTTYMGISVDYRDANDLQSIPTSWIEREQRVLMDIEHAGFFSDYGDKEFIGWNDASFTAYHSCRRDMEIAIQHMKRLETKVEAFRKQYGALTLGKLAVVIAKAIKAKHVVYYDRTNREWIVYAVSADLIDTFVREQQRKVAA